MIGRVSDRVFKYSQLLREDELGMSYSAMVHNVSCDTLSILCLILGDTPKHQKISRNVQLSQAESI
jgi:hypothetical protein